MSQDRQEAIKRAVRMLAYWGSILGTWWIVPDGYGLLIVVAVVMTMAAFFTPWATGKPRGGGPTDV